MSLVYRTAVLSLVVQLAIAGATTAGFFVPIRAESRDDLQIIFALELGSQVIEFVWYLVVVCRQREIGTWSRYIDWVVSTPIMLLSTAMFFSFRRGLGVVGIFEDPWVYASLAFNWAMLAAGFALERGGVPRWLGLGLGGAFLVGTFTSLATLLASPTDDVSAGLFIAMYAVWSLYGVAAALPYTPKNVGYNALDIVSKNFYGVFLLVYALVYEAADED